MKFIKKWIILFIHFKINLCFRQYRYLEVSYFCCVVEWAASKVIQCDLGSSLCQQPSHHLNMAQARCIMKRRSPVKVSLIYIAFLVQYLSNGKKFRALNIIQVFIYMYVWFTYTLKIFVCGINLSQCQLMYMYCLVMSNKNDFVSMWCNGWNLLLLAFIFMGCYHINIWKSCCSYCYWWVWKVAQLSDHYLHHDTCISFMFS